MNKFILTIRKIILITICPVLFTFAACTADLPGSIWQNDASDKPDTLTVMTHDSFAVSAELIEDFESENNLKINFLKSGDTGTALNKAILSKGNPIADVFYGVDNTFLSRALDEGIFEKYISPQLDQIDDEFELDSGHRALPVDYGDVCLNYDKSYFSSMNLSPPGTLEDLLETDYKGMLVVQNPATSSPGLAFLFTTIGHFGDEGYLDYWKSLVDNEMLVVNDWETAYYSEFSGSSGRGPRPVVVSYNSSPVFELIYSETALDEPPTAAVVGHDTCFRQIEFVGILEGTKNRDAAKKWVDFMLSTRFQEDMPLQMFVFPVNSNAMLEDAFIEYLDIPESTSNVSYEKISENREKWISEWTQTVLR